MTNNVGSRRRDFDAAATELARHPFKDLLLCSHRSAKLRVARGSLQCCQVRVDGMLSGAFIAPDRPAAAFLVSTSQVHVVGPADWAMTRPKKQQEPRKR